MTTRQLLRWSLLHERRARRWWASPWLAALAGGAVLAAFVAWRSNEPGPASHAWLAATIVAFALAFMRVPFQLYWRGDAALLAQLPIGGGALFDVALIRCLRAALATAVASSIAAIPLALLPEAAIAEATRQITATPIAGTVPHLSPLGFYLHHAAITGVLVLAAGLLVPGVVVWAASLLVGGTTTPGERASAGAILGAIPGAAGALIIVSTILCDGWLMGQPVDGISAVMLFGVSAASLVALALARQAAPRVMATILRDISALDRQRLATLEIRPPTALERAIAALLGAAGLPYRKDARLMRRRYPMAFALGALIFLVLAIIGLARPLRGSALPWLGAVVGAAVLYAGALAGRLTRPPIELPRLSATLPIAAAARRRAKLAWIVSWSLVFVVAPLAFALARLR
jgi:hypothetical protein